jgi:hypothetical protein
MAWFATRTFGGTCGWPAVAAVGIALLQSTGCATMARGPGSTQEVLVTSMPPGAHVFIGNRMVGTTPVRLDLKRRDSRIVLRLEMDGFAPYGLPVTQSISGWLALDLFPLNPYIAQGLNSAERGPTKWQRAGALALAFGVDFLTGAAYTLPAAVHAVLTPTR